MSTGARPIQRERSAATGLPSREFQELWFATRRMPWRSLAVVPASAGMNTLPIAQALGEVGGIVRMAPIQLLNAEGTDLTRLATMVMDLPHMPAPGAPEPANVRQEAATIVVLEPVVTNPLMLAVAMAVDAVLLCIKPGVTDLESARHTIELIGREKILGAILVR